MNQSKWRELPTEQFNPRSLELDTMDVLEIVDLINSEDAIAVQAVAKERKNIARAIEKTAESLPMGGRLFYVGAGTSGRLGSLDAVECPPTFGTDPEMVQAIIAGGKKALVKSIEGAEDDEQDGHKQIIQSFVRKSDVVIGISASGIAPFVHGALREAKDRGAFTILISCNPKDSRESSKFDLLIAPITGPEVLMGSTRMKAGTATKLVLNSISTGVMVSLGKTYGNLMVDLQPWSNKLRDRAVRVVMMAAGMERNDAEKILKEAKNNVKVAIVMARLGIDQKQALKRLEQQRGMLREVIGKAPHFVER